MSSLQRSQFPKIAGSACYLISSGLRLARLDVAWPGGWLENNNPGTVVPFSWWNVSWSRTSWPVRDGRSQPYVLQHNVGDPLQSFCGSIRVARWSGSDMQSFSLTPKCTASVSKTLDTKWGPFLPRKGRDGVRMTLLYIKTVASFV